MHRERDFTDIAILPRPDVEDLPWGTRLGDLGEVVKPADLSGNRGERLCGFSVDYLRGEDSPGHAGIVRPHGWLGDFGFLLSRLITFSHGFHSADLDDLLRGPIDFELDSLSLLESLEEI